MGAEKRNISLNFLKGIACIGVVFVHINFPGITGSLIKGACQYAVPVFIMIAGYYAFGKNEETIKRRLIKIIRILVFAFAVYFVYRAAFALMDHELISWLKSNFKITMLIKSIVFCSIGFAIPLWYLLAQIETYVLWYFVVKKKKENMLLKLIPVLFMLQVVWTTYCETVGLDWFWKTNFVTRSLAWFLLGYYLHTVPKKKLSDFSNTKLIACALVGLVIVLIPRLFFVRIFFASLGYIPMATALFVLAIKNDEISICKPIEYLGDNMSLWIYIFHVPMDAVINRVLMLSGVPVDNSVVYAWLRPIIALIATVIFSYFIRWPYPVLSSYYRAGLGRAQD